MSTRTEAVYDELRRELLDLSGQFEPGQRLKLLPLAERFDASLSVIREALTRLAGQGLLVATPQRGFSVRELCVADLADLTGVRVQVARRQPDGSWLRLLDQPELSPGP